MMANRMFGPFGYMYWLLILTNIVIPQLLWIKSVRSNVYWLFAISMSINVGMWLERFVIIVVSLHRDFLPSSWGYFRPTWVDVCTYLGTFGLFFTLFLLFMRFLPMIAISEVKGVTPQSDPHHPLGGATHYESPEGEGDLK